MADEKKTLGLPERKDMPAPVNVRETHEDAQAKVNVTSTHANGAHMQVYGRELSDEEFRKNVEGGGIMLSSVMPNPPEVDGYDTTWGTSMQDSQGQLRWMLQNGYSFVTPEEAPHYRHFTPRTAGLDGVISYNELVALKIKKGRKEMLAKKLHHDMPLGLEAALKTEISALSDSARNNVKIKMEEGMREMGKAPSKRPTFSL